MRAHAAFFELSLTNQLLDSGKARVLHFVRFRIRILHSHQIQEMKFLNELELNEHTVFQFSPNEILD